MTKTLVITSCTGQKKLKLKNPLLREDFSDNARLKQREKELNCFCRAAEMYTGSQHTLLMEGIESLRQKYSRSLVDLKILSAGYGLIDEHKLIAPYEVTFNDMNLSDISKWSDHLNIPGDINQAIKDYDIVIFLLGEKYFRALQFPFTGNDKDQRLIFLLGKTGRRIIPQVDPFFHIEVGPKEASSFSYNLFGLKGYLFKLFAQEVLNNATADPLYFIYENPFSFLSAINKYRKIDDEEIGKHGLDINQNQLSLDGDNWYNNYVDIIITSQEEYANNYGFPVQYFIPEWDDRVDPEYNFLKDLHAENRNRYEHDLYAHEIYEKPCYDGILVSKIKIDVSKNVENKVKKLGIHRYMRFPTDLPVMGDCGAFGYIDKFEPPYTNEEILSYYHDLDFNIGVSIDHLIVGKIEKDTEERKRRYNITLDNAASFLKDYRKGNYSFIPSGVAQGWDELSYRNAVGNLIEMGYKHISLGGLVRSQTEKIIQILKAIKPLIPDYLQVHLFGVARINAVQEFRKLGVTSFDSASPLRSAWLGAGNNYYTLDGDKYAAIRIPPASGNSGRVKKMVNEGRGSIEQFKELETKALKTLRAFDKGNASIAKTMQVVLAYDRLVDDNREGNEDRYYRLLEDRPWKYCICKICRELGVEVIIFRGNNRNRRRGFHNTYVFYQRLKQLCPDWVIA